MSLESDQFIRNLRGADDGHDINRDFLDKLFDNVERTEIQMLDDNEYRGGRPAGKKWRSDIIKLLGEGATFRKYGRRGSPKERVVWVSGDLQHVCYGSSHGNSTPEQRIAVKNIAKVVKGMTTEIFLRVVPDESDRNKIEGRCFTLDAQESPPDPDPDPDPDPNSNPSPNPNTNPNPNPTLDAQESPDERTFDLEANNES